MSDNVELNLHAKMQSSASLMCLLAVSWKSLSSLLAVSLLSFLSHGTVRAKITVSCSIQLSHSLKKKNTMEPSEVLVLESREDTEW